MRIFRLIILLGLFAVAGCSGSNGGMTTSDCEQGSASCECYGNGTCDSGLECVANVCAEPIASADVGHMADTDIPSDGGTDNVDAGPQQVRIDGAVNKGPFVLGSTVNVSLLDATTFQSTGDVFITNTTNDLGEFSVDFTVPAAGTFAALQGTGFYYNEVTGNLSNAQISLQAFYKIEVGGSQQAYINLITHLTNGRVRTLLADPGSIDPAFQTGDDFQDAINQAEAELRTQLAIGPTGFDPNAQGTDMNILGDASDLANAYLFAVSSVLAKAAEIRAMGASIDSALQELVNSLASDLADNGVIDNADLVDSIQQGEAEVDPGDVTQKLVDRLAALGQTTPVPDINAILDSNNDGISNNDDGYLCGDGIVHPDQLCFASATEQLGGGAFNFSDSHVADFDGDGNMDYAAGGALQIYFGDGSGVLPQSGTPVPIMDGQLSRNIYRSRYEDFDGDSIGDFVGVSGEHLVILKGTGSRSMPFGAAQFFGDEPDKLYVNLDVADLDGDGDIDITACRRTTTSSECTEIAVFLNDGSGAFGSAGAPSFTFDFAGPSEYTGAIALGNVTGSPAADLVFGLNERVVNGNSTTNENRGVAIFEGNGDGTFATTAQNIPVSIRGMSRTFDITPTDVDGDGDLDLVVDGRGVVDVLIQDNGSFNSDGNLPGGTDDFFERASVADLDGDGDAEIMGYIFDKGLVIYPGSSSGYDASAPRIAFEETPLMELAMAVGGSILAHDMNGDGRLDLVIDNETVLLRNP